MELDSLERMWEEYQDLVDQLEVWRRQIEELRGRIGGGEMGVWKGVGLTRWERYLMGIRALEVGRTGWVDA